MVHMLMRPIQFNHWRWYYEAYGDSTSALFSFLSLFRKRSSSINGDARRTARLLHRQMLRKLFPGDQGYDCVLTGRAANFDGNGNTLAATLHLYLDCYVAYFFVQSCSSSGDFSGIGEVEGSVGCFINTGPYEGSCFTYESSCACPDS